MSAPGPGPGDVDLRPLLAPRSVAIVGDSPGAGRGGLIHDRLVRLGFDGAIFPVNPKYAEIRRLPAYPSVADIPGEVDLVAVAVGAAHAVPVMEACVAKHVRAVLFIASGFAEAGPEGREVQARVASLASENGIVLAGPNCYGVVNVHRRFAAYFGAIAEPLRPGPIAIVFQSGALTHAAMDGIAARSPGYSYIITTGNEAQLELSDYVGWLARDAATEVIACFADGIRTPARFAHAARLAHEAGKRIVMLKVGRSELGRRAALAHTGSIAGEDRVMDAFLADLGVVRVDDVDELAEAMLLAGSYPALPPGNVALVSISGGASGVLADVAAATGLEVTRFRPETEARLRSVLPAFASPNNPLDVTGAVVERPEVLTGALEAVAADPAVGVVAFGLNSATAMDRQERQLYQDLARAVASVAPGLPTPVVLFSLASGATDDRVAEIATTAGIPLLHGITETLGAIAGVQAATGRALEEEAVGAPPPGLLETLDATSGSVLSGAVAGRVLGATGIAVPLGGIARTADEAVGLAADLHAVALKLQLPSVVHRSDIGGVRLRVRGEDEVRRAFDDLVRTAVALGYHHDDVSVEVQEMIPDGVEVLVSSTVHEGMGPVVAFGLGGFFVEALADVALALAPLPEARARRLVGAVPAAQRLLRGYRGQPAADLDALVATLVRLSRLAWWLRDEVAEIELNPVLVRGAGAGAVAVDALIVRKDATVAATRG